MEFRGIIEHHCSQGASAAPAAEMCGQEWAGGGPWLPAALLRAFSPTKIKKKLG